MILRFSFFLLVITLLLNCERSSNSKNKEENIFSTNIQVPPVFVRTIAARQGVFALRIFSSGVLKADEKTLINIQNSGVIAKILVKEGTFIQKGALIMALEDEALQLRLAQARVTLDEATIEKRDLLVLQRGDPNDDNSVSPDRLSIILTRSGYTRADIAVRQAALELAHSKLYAPFSGIIANLKVKPHQQVNGGTEVCTLINPATFEAEFSLLEREALQVKVGQAVWIRIGASPDREYSGIITTINPVVNEQGLVTVRARVNAGAKSQLLEGMNVQVIIEKKILNQIIIPKSAVVLRSARPVVFTFNKKENLAKWNYVTIAYENDTEIAVSEGINSGDLVIYEGNLILDHDVAVKIDTTNQQ